MKNFKIRTVFLVIKIWKLIRLLKLRIGILTCSVTVVENCISGNLIVAVESNRGCLRR